MLLLLRFQPPVWSFYTVSKLRALMVELHSEATKERALEEQEREHREKDSS